MSFGPSARHHEPGVEHADIRRAPRAHARERRRDDLAHDALLQRRGENRGGRVGPHSPCVRSPVAVERALVVLGGAERDCGRAVAQREEARLLAVQKLLDHDLRAGGSECAAEHRLDRRDGLLDRDGYHDALAGGEPIRLDDDRRPALAQVELGSVSLGEAGEGGGRDAEVAAQLLRETLRAFELRRGPRRAERLDPRGREIIHQARDERRLRADHDEADVFRPAERRHGRVVRDVERDVSPALRRAGVARRDEKPVAERARRDGPRQRVLASARADQKDVHGLTLPHPRIAPRGSAPLL